VIWALFGLKIQVLEYLYQRFTIITRFITKYPITTPRKMSFRLSTLLELNTIAFQAFAATSGSSLPFVFGRIIALTEATASGFVRDRCKRPKPVYSMILRALLLYKAFNTYATKL
jgi:hypothetical protein